MLIIGIDNDVIVREITEKDLHKLAQYANNKNVSTNLRDTFPSPYTLQDADNYYQIIKNENPKTTFAIEYKGEYVGNIGLVPGTDVYRNSAELGFFIGEPFWNRGITSKSVNIITTYGFEQLKIVRIFSTVFEFNKASQRVLEKCGFEKEAVSKKAIIKNGVIYDEIRYAKINPNL